MQMLPLDRFHPDFVRAMDKITVLVPRVAKFDCSAQFMAQHLVNMGFFSALLELLLDPAPSSRSSEHRTHYILGISTPPSGAHGPASPRADADALHAVAALIWQVLESATQAQQLGGEQAGQGGNNLVVATVEQLLSSPVALAALVHRALSAEVQEAARAGGDTSAAGCIVAVCGMFRFAAFLLHIGSRSYGGSFAGVSMKLSAFLGLEENLPFLEQLCLPLEPNSTWVHGLLGEIVSLRELIRKLPVPFSLSCRTAPLPIIRCTSAL
jgi:hypothetical protein